MGFLLAIAFIFSVGGYICLRFLGRPNRRFVWVDIWFSHEVPFPIILQPSSFHFLQCVVWLLLRWYWTDFKVDSLEHVYFGVHTLFVSSYPSLSFSHCHHLIICRFLSGNLGTKVLCIAIVASWFYYWSGYVLRHIQLWQSILSAIQPYPRHLQYRWRAWKRLSWPTLHPPPCSSQLPLNVCALLSCPPFHHTVRRSTNSKRTTTYLWDLETLTRLRSLIFKLPNILINT